MGRDNDVVSCPRPSPSEPNGTRRTHGARNKRRSRAAPAFFFVSFTLLGDDEECNNHTPYTNGGGALIEIGWLPFSTRRGAVRLREKKRENGGRNLEKDLEQEEEEVDKDLVNQ